MTLWAFLLVGACVLLASLILGFLAGVSAAGRSPRDVLVEAFQRWLP